jgi:hypothetical protein
VAGGPKPGATTVGYGHTILMDVFLASSGLESLRF